MIYFIPGEEKKFKKGDKVKIILETVKPENNGVEKIILDEFVVDDFFYLAEDECFILKSPKHFSFENLKEKLENGYLIAIRE